MPPELLGHLPIEPTVRLGGTQGVSHVVTLHVCLPCSRSGSGCLLLCKQAPPRQSAAPGGVSMCWVCGHTESVGYKPSHQGELSTSLSPSAVTPGWTPGFAPGDCGPTPLAVMVHLYLYRHACGSLWQLWCAQHDADLLCCVSWDPGCSPLACCCCWC